MIPRAGGAHLSEGPEGGGGGRGENGGGGGSAPRTLVDFELRECINVSENEIP